MGALKQTGTAANSDIAVSIYNVSSDQIDTPRVITKQDHTIVWRWDTAEAFGATAPDQNPSSLGTFAYNQRFPGQTYDAETGLNQNWNRDYNPRWGRYAESDPIGLKGGINTFAYGAADPTRSVDPTGKFVLVLPWIPPILEGLAYLGTAAGAAWAAHELTKPGCPPDKPCPPCKTVSGKVVTVGTIAYRFDPVPPGRPHHPYTGSHYNLYKANQYPSPKCDCFWQPVGAADGADGIPPPSGAIPLEPFAN